MPTYLHVVLTLVLLGAVEPEDGPLAAGSALPRAAEGWSVERVAGIPNGFIPSNSALVASPDGTVYVGGQAGTGVAGGPRPGGSILRITPGKVKLFTEGLGPIGGLEWVDGSLYVLHGTLLSVFRDVAGDGDAPRREDLVSGLGDHAVKFRAEPVAGGLCLGVDGWLYFAVDDRGILKAVGSDRSTARLHGGGVVRVRPDGSGLEPISTGERAPRSVALDASGEIFTLGDPDPAGRWIGGLTHHIDGGRYGYPYQFLTAPFRSLPLLGGGVGGAGGQVVFYDEDGLPASYRGKLFVSDTRNQNVVEIELRRAGGTFKVAGRTPVLERGGVDDFRPVSMAATSEGDGFWVGDAGSPASPSGRLYRLRYTGPDRPRPAPKPATGGLAGRIEALDHPAASVRLASQRALARLGGQAVDPLIRRLGERGQGPCRVHAMRALDATGTEPARDAIRGALGDPSPDLRLQAARSCGRHADAKAVSPLVGLLDDRDPAVRREAAIALGRVGDRAAIAPLMGHLADTDRLAAWSVRTAVRRLGYPDTESMRTALADARRRESALILADESWSVPVLRALAGALEVTSEPEVRGRILSALAGQFRAYPDWDGKWWGPDPLAGEMPRKTREWNPEGSEVVFHGLRQGLADRDASVRFQAIFSLAQVGPPAAPLLRASLTGETDPRNQEAIVESLGTLKDPAAIDLLRDLVADGKRPEALRAAALDALSPYRGPDVLRTRLGLLYDPTTPPSLVARALPPLARAGILPPNDLAGFLEHASPLVRAAALLSVNVKKEPPPELRGLVLARLNDDSADVRQSAVLAIGALNLREAISRLVELAGKPGDPLRPVAISALCRMPDRRALAIYRAAGRDDDPALRRAAEQAIASLAPPVDPAARTAVMTPRPAVEPAALRGFALAHQGDPRKGEELFRNQTGVSCTRCHAGDPGAGRAGPDLAAFVRTRTRAQIVDALLSPRPRVARAHEPMGRLESSFSALEFTDLVGYLQCLNRRGSSPRSQLVPDAPKSQPRP